MDKEELKKAMQDAQNMQVSLAQVQQELELVDVEGFSADRRVKITMSAHGDFKKVSIDPNTLVDGIAHMEAAVLEALQDVTTEAANQAKAKIAAISKQVGLE